MITEDKIVALLERVGLPGYQDRDVVTLSGNAVKFTPEGGRMELALFHRDGEAAIRVKDTGPGIPEAERETVTKRFYRSDKSRRTEGLGLGLSLVAAIVKNARLPFHDRRQPRLHRGDRLHAGTLSRNTPRCASPTVLQG